MPNMTKAEYERLAHYLSLHSPEEEAPAQMAEHRRVLELEAQIAKYEAALQDIANANGEEAFVLSSLRQIEGFQQGVAAQAERAKKALGMAYKEQMPANVLMDAIERYREALEAIIACDTAATYEGYNEFFDGVSVAETALKELARKALGR